MKKFKKDLIGVGAFIFTLLLFFSIFFEPFRIPSGSMIPTLKRGDFILVNNFHYGFKFPFSDLSFHLPFKEKEVSFDPIYLSKFQMPKRGDIVVFKYPQDQTINYIKRVMALPGDTLEIKNKKVFINDEEVKATALAIEDQSGNQYRTFNSVLGQKQFRYQVSETNFYQVNYKKIRIPEGKIFVLGDNRDFSSDSRFWGFVDVKQIKGKAMFIWFSLDSFARISLVL